MTDRPVIPSVRAARAAAQTPGAEATITLLDTARRSEPFPPGTPVRMTFRDWDMGEVSLDAVVRRRFSATHLVVRICGRDYAVAEADCEVLPVAGEVAP